MRSSSLAYDIASKLRSAIMDGVFDLGEPVSEDALSEVFSVSRTPVREALRELQGEGLLEIVPKSGTYVFQPQPEQIVELCDYRLRLETWAVELSISSNKELATRDLAGILDAMKLALEAEDRLEYNRLDSRFHLVFLDYCGNRYVREAYSRTVAQISAMRAHLSSRSASATATSMDEHATILQMFGEGNSSEVIKTLSTHIQRASVNYSAALHQRQAATSASKRTRLKDKLNLTAAKDSVQASRGYVAQIGPERVGN